MINLCASRLQKVCIMLLLSSALYGCGGAGEGEGGESFTAQTAQIENTISVSGRAVKGVISRGLVSVYGVAEQAGKYVQSDSAIALPVRTDNAGYYELNVPGQYAGQPLVIEVSADSETRMTCEVVGGCDEQSMTSFGDAFALDPSFKLSAVSLPIVSGRSNVVHITAFSHMAYASAKASNLGLVESEIRSANRSVESMFSLDEGAIASEPVDVSNPSEISAADAQQAEIAFLSAALQAVSNNSAFNGIAEVVSSLEERLALHDSLALSDQGIEDVVALDDVFYQAELAVSNIASNFSVLSVDLAYSLSTQFSDAQQAAMDQAQTYMPVQINVQPMATSVNSGESFTLSVDAIGGGTLAFQWYRDGIALAGETNAYLHVAVAGASSEADYTVKVSNEVGSVLSVPAAVSVSVLARDVTLSWDIPTGREDGSALALYEIQGYVVRYGESANNMSTQVSVDGAQVTDSVISNLPYGTYYFSIATVDSDGVRGRFSDAVQVTVN